MMKRALMITFFLVTCLGAGKGSKNVAIVKMVRGKAEVGGEGGSSPLKRGMWIKEGGVVKTGPRSFVRLSFIDKSTMNVGPGSEMTIEKFSKDEAGVVNVSAGKIRSQVTKDYLNMDKDRSKMFVKSKSAVMGIRGTDFMFSANKKTGATTAVLFEGSVVFNKFDSNSAPKDLESVVNRGRRINPGQFSVARNDLKAPTVPAKMSSRQFRALEKNKNFDSGDGRKKTAKKKRSAVPPGLNGSVVASASEGLEEGLEKVAKVKPQRKPGSEGPNESSKGYIDGNDVKPVDGSIVHVDSGTVIPLGSDATYDENAQEWVSSSFEVDNTGDVVPPEGYQITQEGKLLKGDKQGAVTEVKIEIKPLDETPPLEQMPEQELQGPEPAGELDDSAPEAESGNIEPESELERLPPPPGETVGVRENFQDPTTGTVSKPTSSPVRINVGKE